MANAEVYPGPPWRLRAAANKEHTAVRVGVQAGLRVRNGGLLDVAVTDANQSNKAHVPVSLEGREPTNARSQGVDQEATHSADGSMPGLAHAPEHTFRVLYVNSYHPGNAWSDQIYVGITEVLSESFGQRVDVSVEYLDGKRYPAALETSLGDRVLAVWEEKYRNCRIDLLLVSDQDAYDLMRRARSSLFPSVPLVFAGVEEPGELDAHTAGVLASTDIRANIEMILQVYPNVQRIWSVTDDSLTGRRNRRGVAALVESFSDRVKLEFFDTGGGIEPRELLSRAEKLGAGDAILFLDYYTSPSGAIDAVDFVRRLATAAPVPVFSHVELHLACDAVGGVMNSGYLQGRQMAELGERVLRGERVDEMSVQSEIAKPMFDYRQLTRFGIPLKRLPVDSRVVNEPGSLWGQYGGYVFLGLVIVLAEAFLIMWLIALVRRQRMLRIEAFKATERFRILFQMAPVPMAYSSRTGQILDLNWQFRAVTGYGIDDVSTLDEWFVVAYPDLQYRREVRECWENSLASGDSVNPKEYRVTCRDGSLRDLEIAATKLGDGLLACLVDVTQRKRAEEAVRESEGVLRSIFDASPAGVAMLVDRRFVKVNSSLCKMTGYSEEELLGNFTRMLYPDDEEFERVGRELYGEMKRVGQGHGEARLRRKDGMDIDVILCLAPVDPADVGAGVCATVLDITERKRAEEVLLRTQFAMDAASDSILWIDDEANILYANDSSCASMGYTREELLGMKVFDIDPDFPVGGWEQHMVELRRRGTMVFESRHRTKDGRAFPVEVRTNYIGCKGRFFACAYDRDITERKRAEEALRQSAEMYRALVEGLPDIVMRFDRDGRHLFVSDNIREVHACEAGQCVGMTHRELNMPAARCEFWEHAIGSVVASGEPFETEFSEDGTKGLRIFNIRLVPERDAEGTVQSVLSVCRDVSAHRLAEQQYQMLFSEMLDGFALYEVVCDEAGEPVDYRYLAVNPAFERLVGLKEEAVVGRTAREVFSGGSHDQSLAFFAQVAKTGEPAFFQHWTEQGEKYFDTTVFRHGPNQLACIFADITGRKRAEAEKDKLQAQLQQAQKMESVGRLAGGVAHDFNNMLSVILGHAELALEQVDPSHPLHTDVVQIRQAAERSADLTRQLLAFARKQTVAPKVLDLNQTIEGMLKMLQRLIGEDIDLVWKPGVDLWPVKMDPSQVDQILANLCINSRDAIDGVGEIMIETENGTFGEEYCQVHAGFMSGQYVRIAVSDNGCGMDRETLAHIYEPFYTTKEVGRGTGLGLATIYGIVKQNNGFINTYSEPGQGTTIMLYLPAHEVPVAPTTEEDRGRVETPCMETILLVEDEPAILRMTETMLDGMGYKVLTADLPSRAIHLAQTYAGQIDLLVTDVVMPEMDGRELANRLLSISPKLKCLFTSGYTANVIAHHGVLDEGVQFIQKPFSMKSLVAKVREVLDADGLASSEASGHP
ncbi:MAG: PAS domain S-box protein [Phycisphaerae bacterium]|nr:PAS domain S-box protein [Phycisphaerae bacterium]